MITEQPLIEKRADIMFDALYAAKIEGRELSKRQLRTALIQANVLDVDDHPQLVADALTRLRQILQPDGCKEQVDVVTCKRAGANSTYSLALTPADARQYREARARHIASEIRTLMRQVTTEQSVFKGTEVFTDAALQYFANGLIELDRAASMELVS